MRCAAQFHDANWACITATAYLGQETDWIRLVYGSGPD